MCGLEIMMCAWQVKHSKLPENRGRWQSRELLGGTRRRAPHSKYAPTWSSHPIPQHTPKRMKPTTRIYSLILLPFAIPALLPPQKYLSPPSPPGRGLAMPSPPAHPSTPSSPGTGTSITLSDVIGSDRTINIFAGFTRDFAPLSQRFEDSKLNTTILAPMNSAIMALDRKAWEDPSGQEHEPLGAAADEGEKGQERARSNLRRFVEAHVVTRSPWEEGEKVQTLTGETLWWEDKGGVKVIQPRNIEVNSVTSKVKNGEVWILRGVIS
ncbi:hypothetical protein PZA11_004280 [Diplocarpon coronariae]